MRVISGSCRGKRLKSVKGTSTRPTADRVKEAVFNVLGTRIVGAKVLDLFAGTGNIGIEALSRGANFVSFVDKDRKAVQVIKDNVNSCKFSQLALIIPLDFLKALNVLKERQLQFDLIFLDPPYKMSVSEVAINKIMEFNLLTDNGIIVAETDQHTSINIDSSHLKKVRESFYGDTKITYFQLQKEDE